MPQHFNPFCLFDSLMTGDSAAYSVQPLPGYPLSFWPVSPEIVSYVWWLVPLLVIGATLLLFRRRANPLFYALAIEFFVLGCILFGEVPPHVNPEFSHSLADALVIAAMLAVTVDGWVKKRLVGEVTKDVSKFLVGYRLPREVQDRIRTLMQTAWVRRDFDLRIRLSQVESEEVELDCSVSNRVQNITTEKLDYTDSLIFARFERFSISEMRCVNQHGADVYRIGPDRITPQDEDGGQLRHSGRKVKIPPVAETEGDMRFSVRYRVNHPPSSSEQVTFNQPTIGATIELTDCPDGFIFHLIPAPDHTAHHRWTYNRLFWPGEQITIQWEKQPQGVE